MRADAKRAKKGRTSKYKFLAGYGVGKIGVKCGMRDVHEFIGFSITIVFSFIGTVKKV
jgi:hypothetical protein